MLDDMYKTFIWSLLICRTFFFSKSSWKMFYQLRLADEINLKNFSGFLHSIFRKEKTWWLCCPVSEWATYTAAGWCRGSSTWSISGLYSALIPLVSALPHFYPLEMWMMIYLVLHLLALGVIKSLNLFISICNLIDDYRSRLLICDFCTTDLPS